MYELEVYDVIFENVSNNMIYYIRNVLILWVYDIILKPFIIFTEGIYLMEENENFFTKCVKEAYVHMKKTIIYLLVALVCTAILYYLKKIDHFTLLFINLFFVASLFEKIVIYQALLKIEKYVISQNLLDKIGNIDFFNKRSYFLTTNYMIIEVSGKVYSFEYSKIKRIYKKYHFGQGISGSKSYLYIITDIGIFEPLAYTSSIVYEDFMDITDYLLKKNPNIQVGKPRK